MEGPIEGDILLGVEAAWCGEVILGYVHYKEIWRYYSSSR